MSFPKSGAVPVELYQPLFDPAHMPFRGLYSYPAISALRPGQWKSLTNARTDDRTMRIRDGIAPVAPLSPGPGVFMGGTIVPFNSYMMAYCAMNNAGVVSVYANQFAGGFWGGWLEQTGAIGKYGNTRVTPSSTGLGTFTLVPNTDGVGSLIFQTGTDDPLLFNMNGLGSNSAIRVRPIQAPIQLGSVAPSATILNTGWTSGVKTYSNNNVGVRFFATDGSSPKSVYLNFAAGYVLGDTCSVRIPAAVDVSQGKQIVFLLKESVSVSLQSLLNNVKIEAWDGGASYVVIHNPLNGIDSRVVVNANLGITAVAFPSSALPPGFLASGFRVTITVVDLAVIPAPTVLELYAVGFGGRVAGGAQHAASFGPSSGLPVESVESPGVVYLPAKATNWAAGSVPSGFVMPLSQSLFFVYNVPIVAPSSADAANAVSQINIYRKDPGETAFTFTQSVDTCEYVGGVWRTVMPTFATFSSFSQLGAAPLVDVFPFEQKQVDAVMPDAFSKVVPRGQVSVYAASRLFVAAGQGVGVSLQNNTVWYSRLNAPYRFRAVSDLTDSRSAGSTRIFSDNIVAMFWLSGSNISVPRIFVFTNNAMYTLAEGSVARMASFGCVSPMGVSEHENILHWVDEQMVVRMLIRRFRTLTRFAIDDKLLSVPTLKRANMSMIWSRNRFYIAKASTSLNDRVLVWNNQLNEWESEDTVPAGLEVAQFIPWTFKGASAIYYFATNGGIFEYEKAGQTTDNGSAISMSGISWEFHNPNWTEMFAGKVQIVCDGQVSGSFNWAWNSVRPVSVSSGSASLVAPAGESLVWSEIHAPGGGPIGARGLGIFGTFNVTANGGWHLYGVSSYLRSYAGSGSD